MYHFLYGGGDKLYSNINFKNDCKMAKKHDENRDLKSLARIAKINPGDKLIKASKNATIGIHMWGKIDFLTRYCGWYFVWDNSAGVGYEGDSNNPKSTREAKKAKKEPKLTDKTKKSKKK